MNCTDVIGYLSPYLDSELDPTTTFQIQAHLSGCQSCRERFDEEAAFERQINGSLRSPKASSDGAWESLLTLAISNAPSAKIHRSRWNMFRAKSKIFFSPLLVAALMLLFFATLIGFGLRHLHVIEKRRQSGSMANNITDILPIQKHTKVTYSTELFCNILYY